MERDNGDELVALGTILRPVGLDGRCRVELHGNSLRSMPIPSEVYLGRDGVQPMAVMLQEVSVSPKGCVCLFGGCSSVEDAEGLRGTAIFTQRSRLPQLVAGRYYHYQLLGLKAILSPSGQVWGNIIGVHNFPASDALEVHTATGEDILVPLTQDVVRGVDLEAGVVAMDAGALKEFL